MILKEPIIAGKSKILIFEMDLNVIQCKNEYYELAQKYLKKIDFVELGINFDEIVSKSISILLNHDFIPTPCIEIKLELYRNQIKTANYFLYVDEKKKFIDEFLC